MLRSTVGRLGIVLFTLAAAFPAVADTQFRIRRMTRDDVPLGKGQCDIRLQVDNEVEVTVRRDTVNIHTIAGRDATDDGSECNAPLPDRDPVGFRFEVLDSRDSIRLLGEPSRRNDFAAIVAIRDNSGGQGRYHFRLSWETTGGDYRGPGDRPGGRPIERPIDRPIDRPGPPPGPPGFMWNDVVSYQGRGRGMATTNGLGDERLFDCQINIDRTGRLSATFRTDRGRALVFSGTMRDRESGGRLRAEVASENGRFRGPMWITLDRGRQVDSVTFEDAGGRDRMRLAWDRR